MPGGETVGDQTLRRVQRTIPKGSPIRSVVEDLRCDSHKDTLRVRHGREGVFDRVLSLDSGGCGRARGAQPLGERRDALYSRTNTRPEVRQGKIKHGGKRFGEECHNLNQNTPTDPGNRRKLTQHESAALPPDS